MAKKKKKHTTHRRSPRRRMSGLGHGMGNDLMEVLGLVFGNVGATIVQRQATSINPKLVSGFELVGGYMLKKRSHSPFMQGISLGLMSAGAIGLTHQLGMIRGVEDFVNGLGDGDMSGYEAEMRGLSNEHYSVMNGLSNESSMSGSMVGAMDLINEM